MKPYNKMMNLLFERIKNLSIQDGTEIFPCYKIQKFKPGKGFFTSQSGLLNNAPGYQNR